MAFFGDMLQTTELGHTRLEPPHVSVGTLHVIRSPEEVGERQIAH